MHQHQRTTAPTLQDMLTCLHTLSRPDVTMLKFDVRKAHRRILLQKKDWRFITARIKGNVWVNKVGTYGVASAQFHWGRMAALILRIQNNTFPQILWGFVFVNDFGILLSQSQAMLHTAAIIALLEARGPPFSWKRPALGTSATGSDT